MDLTAYRIVQEALTNALRHAPGSAATVALTYEADHLSVQGNQHLPHPATPPATPTTAQPPPPPPPPPPTPPLLPPPATLAGGYGLAGIAERVASCGGSLALGPAPGGGFTVTARLPLT